ncbi:monooxygenase 2 isoform X2 [Ricinus communis]|uniref:monooxygenase 2 isoform X2 n=1 Tax=Ricinus communis TaxID=3988 RepID=UPI0007728B0C|nr:monooxygenase 2 isoform X2 [Ricinus communis]|eukprot:XP_015581418.1 monooxygenase 2 isoform X2 [Ricinus communis]
MEDAVIVGAGIAGLATAVALKRVGIRALVLERSDTLRTTGAALTLFPNAWLALDALGVSHKLTSLYSPISGGSVTKVDTGAVQEISFAANIEPRSVHRRALLEALAQELPPDSVKFSAKITTIDVQEQNGASSAVVCLEDGTTIKSKVLIGCDGVHSVVAKWLGLSEPIHSGKRAGFVPLNDKELYWFLSCNEGKDVPKDPEVIQKEIIEKYAVKFPSLYLDVVRHADLSSLTWAPLMLRNPLDMIFGNVNKRNVTVAGDAMHPMTSDLGQGGCLALEDAVVLGRHISNSFIKNGRLVPEEMARALDAYGKERRWRAAWLITGSYLSGWFQQGGSNWLMKFLRDVVFYGFLFRKLSSAVLYDCGTLPAASGDQLHSSNKTD